MFSSQQHKAILKEILHVTAKIQSEFPTLYSTLSESPDSYMMPEEGSGIIEFSTYLDSIKVQLSRLQNSHPILY